MHYILCIVFHVFYSRLCVLLVHLYIVCSMHVLYFIVLYFLVFIYYLSIVFYTFSSMLPPPCINNSLHAMYYMQNILCNLFYTFYNILILLLALYSQHCIPCILFHRLYSMYYILCIIFYVLYSIFKYWRYFNRSACLSVCVQKTSTNRAGGAESFKKLLQRFYRNN